MLREWLKKIYRPFLLSLGVMLFATVFFPSIRLSAFAPFLALVFMRSGFLPSLWVAAIAGLVMDLFSSQLRFGAFSLIYSLTALLTYHQKRLFFADKPQALSLYTALISAVLSLLELFFLTSVDPRFPLNFRVITTDVLGMSLLDAVYAFLCFTLPMKIYNHLKRLGGFRRFLLKKDA